MSIGCISWHTPPPGGRAWAKDEREQAGARTEGGGDDIGLVDVENEYLFDFLFFALLQHNASASGLTEPTTPLTASASSTPVGAA